jgi:hypothetical protein
MGISYFYFRIFDLRLLFQEGNWGVKRELGVLRLFPQQYEDPSLNIQVF